ncbi:stalk domain-containing protein [Cohnella laeviribosi]|uniref:stalk domain-containing protein n=1 Tax=Cohnella laeviribosi TaxID=380174 RepID=UPI00036A6F98|nr:stalk domain-containing protein [Cohnella laeviribosi]
MKSGRFLSVLMAVSLISAAALLPDPAPAKAATPAYAQLNLIGGGTLSVGNAWVKNGVSYLDSSVLANFGFEMHWNDTKTRAEFKAFEKSFAVRTGSRIGILDGQKTDLGGVPFVYRDTLFLPASFMVKTLEGKSLRWDPKTKTIIADGLHTYRGHTEVFNGAVYSLSYETGDLRVSAGNGPKRKIANLGTKLDIVDFKFEQTPKGLILLRIRNVYGEPHIHYEHFLFLLKDGGVIRQTSTYFRASFNDPALWSDGKILMNDGITLRLIEDGTGQVAETVNLAELMGEDDSSASYYNVEGFFPDFALIRPLDTGILTLVNRGTGEQVPLYRVFFDEELQQRVEQYAPMILGDFLRFTGRDGDRLTFTYYNGKEDLIFTYDLPASAS